MTAEAHLYDIRYSRYDGAREARWRSVLAMARSSTGRALGLRRTAGSKVWPFLLIAAAHLPAIATVGVPLLFDGAPEPLELMPYSQLLAVLTPIVVAFAATTLPSLLTRERRDRVLSLYFSTAMSPWEYLAGKVLAALALMSLVTLSPLLVLLIGSILTSEAPLDALRDDGRHVLAVILAGLVCALWFAALGLTAGAMTSKRLFAIGGLLAVLLVTPILSGLVSSLTDQPSVRAADLSQVPLRATTDLLPGRGYDDEGSGKPAQALVWSVWGAVLLAATTVLVLRYRDPDAS